MFMVVNLSGLLAQDLNRFLARRDLVRKIKDHIPGKESEEERSRQKIRKEKLIHFSMKCSLCPEERRIFILTATAVLIMRNKE